MTIYLKNKNPQKSNFLDYCIRLDLFFKNSICFFLVSETHFIIESVMHIEYESR